MDITYKVTSDFGNQIRSRSQQLGCYSFDEAVHVMIVLQDLQREYHQKTRKHRSFVVVDPSGTVVAATKNSYFAE